MKRIAFALVLLLACEANATTMNDFLRAIRQVETGGEPNGGRDSVGDNGRSIGPLQIQRACWIDSRVPGSYEDCRDYDYACRVALAYFARYCPSALANNDWQTMARVWNGGPKGASKAATLGYWRKVELQLKGGGK